MTIRRLPPWLAMALLLQGVPHGGGRAQPLPAGPGLAEAGDVAAHDTHAGQSDAVDRAGGIPAASLVPFAGAIPVAIPVADDELAQARGGFDTGTGLLVSLSVERVLSLNGDAVASSSLSLRDVAAAVRGGTPAVPVAAGIGGSPWQGAGGQLPALLLQNAANGQLIRGLTTIDAGVNSLPMLKDLNFGDSLRQALSSPVVPR